MGDSFQTLVSERVVVQVDLTQFILVRQDGSDLFCTNLGDLVTLKIQREESVILFKGFGQSYDTFILNVIVFEANLF